MNTENLLGIYDALTKEWKKDLGREEWWLGNQKSVTQINPHITHTYVRTYITYINTCIRTYTYIHKHTYEFNIIQVLHTSFCCRCSIYYFSCCLWMKLLLWSVPTWPVLTCGLKPGSVDMFQPYATSSFLLFPPLSFSLSLPLSLVLISHPLTF